MRPGTGAGTGKTGGWAGGGLRTDAGAGGRGILECGPYFRDSHIDIPLSFLNVKRRNVHNMLLCRFVLYVFVFHVREDTNYTF